MTADVGDIDPSWRGQYGMTVVLAERVTSAMNKYVLKSFSGNAIKEAKGVGSFACRD